MPLGITEQHGYHLPLSTDVHNAWQVAVRVSERTGAVVAPALPYAYSGGTLPGTINVSPQVTGLMVAEIVESLAEQGFRNVVVVLGHAGSENLRAMRDQVTMLMRRFGHAPELAVALAPVWEFSKRWMKGFREKDYHAGEIETSLMMYWAGEMVRMERMRQDEKKVAASLREDPDNYQKVVRAVEDRHVAPRVTQREEIEVGVMGFPERASVQTGRKVCQECVEGIVGLVKRMEGRRGARRGRRRREK